MREMLLAHLPGYPGHLAGACCTTAWAWLLSQHKVYPVSKICLERLGGQAHGCFLPEESYRHTQWQRHGVVCRMCVPDRHKDEHTQWLMATRSPMSLGTECTCLYPHPGVGKTDWA